MATLPESTVSEPTPAPTNSGFRDDSLEQATLSKLNVSPTQAAQLADNPAFQKQLFEMTYGANANKIPEYQQLTQSEQEREGLGDQLGDIRQNAPNAMLALEDALRTKTDVGNQKLGESELFQKAGLTGFFNLNQSLGEQSKVMEERYGSFINALSRVGQYQVNQYRALGDQYKTLTDEYNQKKEDMNAVFERIQAQENALQMAEKQAALQKELALYERQLELGDYDRTTMDRNREDWDNGRIRSANSSDITNMVTVDQYAANGDNCILWLRDNGVEMPYGLFSAEDKREAIRRAGSTDMSQARVGDVILTSEGQYGHGARIIAINPDGSLVLEEANYKAGLVTKGRTLDANDKVVLGFIPQGRKATTGNSFIDEYLNKAAGSALSAEISDAADREGTVPSIEEQVLAEKGSSKTESEVYYRLDLANAGESTQVVKSNTAAIEAALETGDPEKIEAAIFEVERKKFEDRTKPIVTEFNKGINDWEEIQGKYNTMVSAMDSYYASGKTNATFVDQAIISLFNKITDPTSVVRESEFERTGQSLGLDDRIIGAASKQLKGGAGLTDETREAALKIAQALAEGAKITFKQELEKAKSKAGGQSIPDHYLRTQLGLNEDWEFGVYEQALQRGQEQSASLVMTDLIKQSGLSEKAQLVAAGVQTAGLYDIDGMLQSLESQQDLNDMESWLLSLIKQ